MSTQADADKKHRYTIIARYPRANPREAGGTGDNLTFEVECCELDYRQYYNALDNGGWAIIHAWRTEEHAVGAMRGNW